MRRPRFASLYILAAAAAIFLLLLLRYPEESLQSAVLGVSVWWDVLFPALFPFLLISEMMLGFGIVHFFGTVLDPLMRPLFRVPGIGGFVMAMGFASGYPVAARLTAQLWEQRLVTREEGERLVSFATTADPIFLIGAVAVGFFTDVRLAVVLVVSHYGAAVLIGLAMRFHGRAARPSPLAASGRGSLLRRSFEAMHRARVTDGRPIGLLLQDAVRSSLQLVFVIGGLVVFFSVIMETLRLSHALDTVFAAVNFALHGIGVPQELAAAIVSGLFEVTLGAKAAGQAGASLPLADKAAAAAFVLSWAGLSVHAQIVSLLHRTNLRYAPFLAARFAHGLLAAVLVTLLWQKLMPPHSSTESAMIQGNAGSADAFFFFAELPVWREWALTLPLSILLFTVVILSLISLRILHWFSQRLYNGLEKPR